LTQKDTLIIIIDEEPNETILTKIRFIYEKNGIFVVIHNIKRLQFNLLNHNLVPMVDILSDKETEELKTQYHLKDVKQLPEISRFDPVALAILLRPGQIAKFMRDSPTAFQVPYYRICR
jgi:DNA-directed RNA polymerase subunit H (RpoH/RPB5)